MPTARSQDEEKGMEQRQRLRFTSSDKTEDCYAIFVGVSLSELGAPCTKKGKGYSRSLRERRQK